MTTEFCFKTFKEVLKKHTTAQDKRDYVSSVHDELRGFVARRVSDVASKFAEKFNVDDVCQLFSVKKPFNLKKLEEFFDSLNDTSENGKVILERAVGIVDVGALGFLRTALEPTPPITADELAGRQESETKAPAEPPQKPKPVKIEKIFSDSADKFGFIALSLEFYASIEAELMARAKSAKGYKAAMIAASNEKSGKQLPTALQDLDRVLQGVVNLGAFEYITRDDLGMFNKLFSCECAVLKGKKRGLGSELERYIKMLFPCLNLKSVGEGSLRRYEWTKKRGAARELHVFGIPSRLPGGKPATVPFLDFRGFLLLERELKAAKAALSKAANTKFEAESKEWEQNMPLDRKIALESAIADSLKASLEKQLSKIESLQSAK